MPQILPPQLAAIRKELEARTDLWRVLTKLAELELARATEELAAKTSR